MKSRVDLRMTPATISSLKRVLKATSHKIRNLIFHSVCPWQPPTLPFALPPRRRVHLPRNRGVADQLPEPNPKWSHQIQTTQRIQLLSVRRLLGGSKLHLSGVKEDGVLLQLAALLDDDADVGDALKVTSLIKSPTSAMASLNLRTMTQSRHPRTLNPSRYVS